MSYKYFLYWLIGLLVYWFIPAPLALAAGEFQADYDLNYAISPSGTTIVTQKVVLTNKLSNLYPQKYSLVLDSDKITNVIAYDAGGVITPALSVKDGQTEITLAFNQQVVGLGRQLEFTLRYHNADIARKQGKIWEINIPGVKEDPDIVSYNVSLEVPPTFGPNAYLTPQPAAGRRWNKEQMVRGGISAAYGTDQLFDLTLSYYLENPQVTEAMGEIALPTDTDYQKVIIRELSPQPKAVVKDEDGNWLASFGLTPGQKLEITAKVAVSVLLAPRSDTPKVTADVSVYLKPAKYWESDSPQIKELAQKYRTPREIYNYVVSTLVYDYSRASSGPVRKGAQEALNSPQTAVCMEFTDLFIAIARAAGIPARELVGYAYTNNPRLRPLSLVADVLHAWPEYYDQEGQRWIPIDPTWADTTGGVNYFDKLDFNHIVFAIHGTKSDYPYPAGFYRQSGKTGKDVLVAFSETPNIPTQTKLNVRFDFPKTIPAGWSTSGSVVVENQGNVSLAASLINIDVQPFNLHLSRSGVTLPPLGSVTFPITLPARGYLAREKIQFQVGVNDELFNFTAEIVPQYWLIVPLALGLSLLLLVPLIWRKKIWILPPK